MFAPKFQLCEELINVILWICSQKSEQKYAILSDLPLRVVANTIQANWAEQCKITRKIGWNLLKVVQFIAVTNKKWFSLLL